jgi:hypothetical protein
VPLRFATGRHLTGFASLRASHPFGPSRRLTQNLHTEAKTQQKNIFSKKNKKNLQNKKHTVYLQRIS